jgi:hypothetical protein
MTAKKTEVEPVYSAPMTFRDFPDVPESAPVVAMLAPPSPDPVTEPAKPASKKEN